MAECEAADPLGGLARLTIENNKMRARLKTADAQITALEELKLPAATELVSKLLGTRQVDDTGSGSGEAGSESASTDHKPRPPGRRS